MAESRKWMCVEVVCEEPMKEELAAFIGERFSVAVEITQKGIRFYLDRGGLADDWESGLQEILNHPGAPYARRGFFDYSIYDLPEVNWEDRWKEHFKPLRIGKRFVICPTWEVFVPDPLDRLIRIDPGRAFGTGHHETTRLCLEWLEDLAASERNVSGESLLDVGTGSGILAVASVLLGFNPVVGVDNDPEAIEVAMENIAVNHVEGRIRLFSGTTMEIEGVFNVILANIQAQPLLDMAPALVRRLNPGGRLALSGLLLEQMDEVSNAYVEKGLRLIGTRLAGEWGLLDFEK